MMHQWPGKLLQYLQIVLLGSLLLYFGRTLFIPLCFGLLAAIIMYPICHWLEKKGWQRSLAITACIGIITLLFGLLIALLVWQFNLLKSDIPAIMEKANQQLPTLQKWLINNLGVDEAQQQSWFNNTLSTLGGKLAASFSGFINNLFMLFLSPVFMALFLYHRGVFVKSLQLLAGNRFQKTLDEILRSTIFTYFNFIKGMALVYIIVGVLNALGLWALGIRHPLLFGMLCAIMTIIPYVGIIISALLPISMAWLDSNSLWLPLGVVAVFSIVQYLEANVIFPTIVGTQLNISTWATLIAILAGGIIWGISGMILFIPFVAILKITTDHLPAWKPLNLLLGRN